MIFNNLLSMKFHILDHKNHLHILGDKFFEMHCNQVFRDLFLAEYQVLLDPFHIHSLIEINTQLSEKNRICLNEH